jgi:hypothetical protein
MLRHQLWEKYAVTGEMAGTTAPCSDCRALKNGSRTLPGPHPYLMAVGSTEPANPAATSYRCLICENKLTHEWIGNEASWR